MLLQGMSMQHYDAINLGEKDLQYGIDYLEDKRRKFDLPFVSANIYRKDTGKLFVESFVIRQIGDIKVGVFGVSGTFITSKVKENFEIADPTETAKKMVARLKGECDVVVALAHLGLANAKQLAADVPGIDFGVSGHRWDVSRKPELVGATVVMQPGSKGKYLGHIDFDVVDGQVNLVQGKAVSLSAHIKDDKRLAELVAEFEQKSEGTP